MENWNNLTVILEKLKEDSKRKDFLNKLLIEESSKGNKETVKKVLQAGASLNCYSGVYTPLIASLKGDFVDVTNYLVKVGASPSYRPTDIFIDAVWYALINKKYIPFRLFLKTQCLLNHHPIHGKTLLGFATDESDVDGVLALVHHKKINVNEKDKKGNTALHYNMQKMEMNDNDIKIGKILLAQGASTMIRNNDGKSPSELAATAGESLILESELIQEVENINQNNPQPRPQAKKVKF